MQHTQDCNKGIRAYYSPNYSLKNHKILVLIFPIIKQGVSGRIIKNLRHLIPLGRKTRQSFSVFWVHNTGEKEQLLRRTRNHLFWCFSF